MFEKLETERLIIRGFQEEDWKNIFTYMSDPGVTGYLPYDPFTEEDTRKFIQENMGEDARIFPVVIREDGRWIGHMVYHVWDGRFRTWEIGWAFNRAYHGCGFATEAAKRKLQYGFEEMGLLRIIATCDPRNIASLPSDGEKRNAAGRPQHQVHREKRGVGRRVLLRDTGRGMEI